VVLHGAGIILRSRETKDYRMDIETAENQLRPVLEELKNLYKILSQVPMAPLTKDILIRTFLNTEIPSYYHEEPL